MTIKKADAMGYCMGVRRAMDSAFKAIDDYPEKQIYSLGPLIHNQSALDMLSNQGLKILDSNNIEEISSKVDKNSVVIVRAHGVAPAILQSLEKTSCTVVNATCPRVLSNQKRAADFAKKGYTVIIAGDKNHGEVTGLAGFVSQFCSDYYVIQNSTDAKALPDLLSENSKGVVLLSQTTISKKEYEEIGDVLKAKYPDLQILNTICPATKERQDALKALCREVDGVVVIGGKTSANTCRLYYMAKSYSENPDFKCKMACHIERPEEVPEEFFKLEKVGLTAGASTPDEVIQAVENRFK